MRILKTIGWHCLIEIGYSSSSSSSSSSKHNNNGDDDDNKVLKISPDIFLLDYDQLYIKGNRHNSDSFLVKQAENNQNYPEAAASRNQKNHDIVICNDCFNFNSDSRWAIQKSREMKYRTFKNHEKSEEHKIALNNKRESKVVPVTDQVGH